MGREKQTFKFKGLHYKDMKKVKIKGEEFDLEDKDAALILAIQELTTAINLLRCVVKNG